MGIRAVDPSEIAPLLEAAILGERDRILKIIESDEWFNYSGGEYFTPCDKYISLAKLKALIRGEGEGARSS